MRRAESRSIRKWFEFLGSPGRLDSRVRDLLTFEDVGPSSRRSSSHVGRELALVSERAAAAP
jgi:hypothetical protein